VPLSKLTLLYNGIVVPELPQTTDGRVRDQQRAQWGFDDGHIVIASVGRLSAEKNHGLLLDVAALLKQGGSRCRFVIVGDGPMRSTIEQRIRSLGIESDVFLTGHVDDMTAIYAGVDVLAIHSLREGLPNVLLEAMLARIPVVSVPVGGVPEVIAGERGGILTKGWHAEEFAHALQRLADADALRSQLGAQGRELVSSKFSFQRRMNSITAEYERLLV
jgi:glycosyltransferase involved in cell wall biosynthesis